MPDPTLDALTQRLQAQDPTALGPFIKLHEARLLRFIEGKLGTGVRRKVEAEDLLQEVAATAVDALPRYEMGDRDPYGWLCQLAERRIIDTHRRFAAARRDQDRETSGNAPAQDASRQMGLIDVLVASLTSPSKVLSRNWRIDRMRQALDELKPDQREAITLRYLKGCSNDEIAERLGRTNGAVRVLLTRSLGKLGDLMAASEPDTKD